MPNAAHDDEFDSADTEVIEWTAPPAEPRVARPIKPAARKLERRSSSVTAPARPAGSARSGIAAVFLKGAIAVLALAGTAGIGYAAAMTKLTVNAPSTEAIGAEAIAGELNAPSASGAVPASPPAPAPVPDPLPADRAPATTAPGSAPPTIEPAPPARQPELPAEVTRAIAKKRWPAALSAAGKIQDRALADRARDQIRRGWSAALDAQVARSNDTDAVLDGVAAFRAAWPKDQAIARVAARAEEKHRSELDRVTNNLRARGLDAVLVPAEPGRREYVISAVIKPDRDTVLAAVADPMLAGLSMFSETFTKVAAATRGMAIRANRVEIRINGTKDGFGFPTRCAHEFVAKSEAERLATMECVKALVYR